MNTVTVKTEEYEIVFKNSIINTVRFTHLFENWVEETEEDALSGLRSRFAYVLAHIETWKGKVWSLPKSDSSAELEKAFAGFIATFDFEQMNEMEDAIASIKSPMSSQVEKPDRMLTAEEAADPN